MCVLIAFYYRCSREKRQASTGRKFESVFVLTLTNQSWTLWNAWKFFRDDAILELLNCIHISKVTSSAENLHTSHCPSWSRNYKNVEGVYFLKTRPPHCQLARRNPLGLLPVPKDENPVKETKIWGYHKDWHWIACGAGQHHEIGVLEMLLAVREVMGPSL